MYFATLGVVASSIERLATEIRHLQRTECWRPRSISRKGRRAPPRCPTSATRC
jgi:adenylosuccinate lyase